MTVVVHRDRYSTSSVKQPKRGVVVHASESGDGTFDTLLYLMTRPGDRVIPGSNPPRMFGAAYHAVANGATGDYTQVLPGAAGPYSASGANKDFWHICLPGRAAQTREEWLDPLSRGQIKAVAHFIVDKAKADGFPIRRITAAEVKAGGRGYCGHVDITNAYHLSDHTDPGINFPWDVLMFDIIAILTPTTPEPEDDMRLINPPLRVYNSRNDNAPLKAGERRVIPVALSDPSAVAVNLTVIPENADKGWLVAWDAGDKPDTSNVNWRDGRTAANLAIVAVNNNRITVEATAPCHLAIDLQAYWP